MSTYTQILYQIVFSTKNRKPTLERDNRPELFKFIWGVIKNKKCRLYRINAVEDHVHILLQLHPTIALASLVKDIKVGSSAFIKDERIFPHFEGWQVGYAAFTYSFEARGTLIEYIKNQEVHHQRKTFKEEMISLFQENGIVFEERYF